MTDRQNPRISQRKQPQQARSTELIAIILEAATQVLAKDGAQNFTTARVAERAGVSIGSLYQYFPNKASILFRLQSDEWQQSSDMFSVILDDDQQPPLERLRLMVHAFIHSECEEAAMRMALHDAAPLYRHAPEAQEVKASGAQKMRAFMRKALANAPEATQILAGDLILLTMSTVGKRFSEQPRTTAEIDEYAGAMADMLCAYLRELDLQAIKS